MLVVDEIQPRERLSLALVAEVSKSEDDLVKRHKFEPQVVESWNVTLESWSSWKEMIKRWWLWKVVVTRVELVFVLFVLYMTCCFCYPRRGKW